MLADIDYIKKDLKERLSKNRYNHSLNVMETAAELAKFWGADVEKCKLAGLVHDCGKLKDKNKIIEHCKTYNVELTDEEKNNPNVIHAFLGEKLAEVLYGIDDPEILEAIRYHTTGEKNMTLISKIIFLADYIEPGRNGMHFEDVKKEAYKNIDKAMLKAYDYNIEKLLRLGEVIHTSTIRGRNDIVIRMKN
jgi:predicted HD superfamily hydrolase involved in NAD metabolism